jgi:acyl-CoA hydrolase
MWFAGPGDRISRITTSDPPTLAAAGATGVGATTAHLSGTVNPNGGATGVAFQYGTTTAYGQTTPVQRAGDGFSPVAIAADLTGLAPGTVYHYRLAGLTAAGQAATADQTFRTSGTGAPAPIGATVSVRAKTYRDGTTALAITVRKVPAATTIVMTCRSASRARKANRCPFTRVKLVEKTAQPAVELARYFKHRRLAAGTRVGVTLTKPGAPGAVTRVTTRKRKRPSVQRLSA